MMKLAAPFVVILSWLHSTSAFSTGAGRCVVGEPGPQGNHPPLTDGGGGLQPAGYTIQVDGIPVANNAPTVFAEETFEITVSGPDFRGFLIMIADEEEGALLGRRPEAQQAQGAGCAGTASVTHTSNDFKQEVTVVGIVPEATTTTIELNVVVANSGGESIYYYSQIPLVVIEPQLPIETGAPTGTPTASPTDAPTDTPATEDPTSAPTDIPTEEPTSAPTEETDAPSPVTAAPTEFIPLPSAAPTSAPTEFMPLPSATPSGAPTEFEALPSAPPSVVPSTEPSTVPSSAPSEPEASEEPSLAPSWMPSSAPIESEPELTGAPTDVPLPTFPPLEEGDVICDEGFIMDNYCIALGVLLDNQTVVTLENPELHSFHCLLDVSVCVQSNYTMLREPGANETMYSVAYEFDAVGSALLQDLGQSVGMNGYCSSCMNEEGGQEYGFRAAVLGTVVDASVDPPLVNITAVYPSNGTITDEIVAFCNATDLPPDTNATEAPNATSIPNATDAPVPIPQTSEPQIEEATEAPTSNPTLGADTSSAFKVGASAVLFAFSVLIAA